MCFSLSHKQFSAKSQRKWTTKTVNVKKKIGNNFPWPVPRAIIGLLPVLISTIEMKSKC